MEPNHIPGEFRKILRVMLRLITAWVIVIGIPACGRTPVDMPVLSHTFSSPEEVCRHVLEALASNDTLGLHGLILTRFEHDSILVPQMSIGKDTSGGKDLNLAWFMLEQRSVKGVRRALADYGGQHFEFVSLRFRRPEEIYGPLIVHKGTEVRVRNVDSEELVLGIFGSILEQNERYKLVSIRD